MKKIFIIKIESRLEGKLNLSSLKLKDNESLIIDNGNFETEFHNLLNEKYGNEAYESNVTLIDVMSNKVYYRCNDFLSRTLINVREDMSMKDFVSQLLEVVNNEDTNFVNFIKYNPYFQLSNNQEINIMFNNMDLKNIKNNNLIVYNDRVTLSYTLNQYPNIAYSCIDDNKEKGFIFYKESPLKTK